MRCVRLSLTRLFAACAVISVFAFTGCFPFPEPEPPFDSSDRGKIRIINESPHTVTVRVAGVAGSAEITFAEITLEPGKCGIIRYLTRWPDAVLVKGIGTVRISLPGRVIERKVFAIQDVLVHGDELNVEVLISGTVSRGHALLNLEKTQTKQPEPFQCASDEPPPDGGTSLPKIKLMASSLDGGTTFTVDGIEYVLTPSECRTVESNTVGSIRYLVTATPNNAPAGFTPVRQDIGIDGDTNYTITVRREVNETDNTVSHFPEAIEASPTETLQCSVPREHRRDLWLASLCTLALAGCCGMVVLNRYG